MANAPSRLLALLNLPATRQEFVKNFDGNTGATDSLIRAVQEKQKDAELSPIAARMEQTIANDGVSYEDIVDTLADDLYGPMSKQSGIKGKKEPPPTPTKKSGIQGKDTKAKPEVVAGDPPATAAKEGAVLSDTPKGEAAADAATDSGVNASPSALAAAKKYEVDLANVKGTGKGGTITQRDVMAARGRAAEPVKEPAATPAPAADQTAATDAEEADEMTGVDPFGGNFVSAAGAAPSMTDVVSPNMAGVPGTTAGSVGAFGDSVSLPGASPLQRYNPFEGIDFSQFQGGTAGVTPQPAMPLPTPGPQPVPGMSIDDQIAGMDALDFRTPPAQPTDYIGLLGDLMDGYNSSGGMPGDYGPSPFTPSGGMPGTYGPELPPFDSMGGINSVGGMDGGYGPEPPPFDSMAGLNAFGGADGRFGPEVPPGFSSPGTGGGDPPPKPPFMPVTSMVKEFMKARDLEGLNTGPLTKPIDFALRNSPWIIPTAIGAAAGYSALNTPAPQPPAFSPPTDDEIAADEERYRLSLEALKTIQGPPKPIAIPRR